MNTKYVIEDITLSGIADAIRQQTNETKEINTLDFASKIANIDLPTYAYMMLYDLPDAIKGVTRVWDFNYNEIEVGKVNWLLEKLGGELNG